MVKETTDILLAGKDHKSWISIIDSNNPTLGTFVEGVGESYSLLYIGK